MVDVERWLSYKGTCHVILLAKLHDMYVFKTDNFFHISHYLMSVSKMALLHRFHCKLKSKKYFYLSKVYQLTKLPCVCMRNACMFYCMRKPARCITTVLSTSIRKSFFCQALYTEEVQLETFVMI